MLFSSVKKKYFGYKYQTHPQKKTSCGRSGCKNKIRFKEKDLPRKTDTLGTYQNKERIETLSKWIVSIVNNLATMLITTPKEVSLEEKLDHC